MTDVNPYIIAIQRVAEEAGFKRISIETLNAIVKTYISRFNPPNVATQKRDIAILDDFKPLIPPVPTNVISFHRKRP